jgi:hypothetical protein
MAVDAVNQKRKSPFTIIVRVYRITTYLIILATTYRVPSLVIVAFPMHGQRDRSCLLNTAFHLYLRVSRLSASIDVRTVNTLENSRILLRTDQNTLYIDDVKVMCFFGEFSFEGKGMGCVGFWVDNRGTS